MTRGKTAIIAGALTLFFAALLSVPASAALKDTSSDISKLRPTLAPLSPLEKVPEKEGTEKEKGDEEEANDAKKKANEVEKKAEPTAAELYLEEIRLGSVFAVRGELEAALASYKRAIKLRDDDPDAYFGYANILLRMKKPKEAALNYTKALEFEPKNATYHNNLAWALMEAGSLEKALKTVLKALEFDPPGAPTYLDTKAMIELRSGLTATAERSFKEALTKSPPGDYISRIIILRHLLELYKKIGDKESVAAVERVINNIDTNSVEGDKKALDKDKKTGKEPAKEGDKKP